MTATQREHEAEWVRLGHELFCAERMAYNQAQGREAICTCYIVKPYPEED